MTSTTAFFHHYSVFFALSLILFEQHQFSMSANVSMRAYGLCLIYIEKSYELNSVISEVLLSNKMIKCVRTARAERVD